MPNIKIFQIIQNEIGYDKYEDPIYVEKILSETPWETVTDDELQDLKLWATSTTRDYSRDTDKYIIVVQQTVESIRPLVQEYIKKSKDERLKQENLLKQQKEKAAQAAAKRKATEDERKRKRLEKLKRELGEN